MIRTIMLSAFFSITLATVEVSAMSISAGGTHTCSIKNDASVACWGDDAAGRTSPPSGIFTQISVGYSHTCGIKKEGSVNCWGYDLWDRTSPPSGIFTQIGAGVNHTCGIKTDGSVACWGYDVNGQASPPSGTFTQVSAGVSHTCGIKTDGSVACWGYDVYGQASPPSGTFTQVSAGGDHTCGIKTDGSVVCWGYDVVGQASPPSGTFTQVSAGVNHTCGIKTDGSVACWGYDGYGQASPPSGTFTQVSADRWHTCGIKTDGSVACWGYDGDGQASPPANALVTVPETTIPPVPDSNATLSGFVRTPDGQGVEGVTVCISNTNEQQCQWVHTDTNGYFSLDSLSSGDYVVFPISPTGQFTFTSGSGDILISNGRPTPESIVFSAEKGTSMNGISVKDIPSTAIPLSFPQDTIQGHIDTGGLIGQNCYKIEVPDSNTLTAHTMSNGDTYGFLVNSNNDYIASDENSGEGQNFRMTTQVEADTYYLCVLVFDRGSVDYAAQLLDYTLDVSFTAVIRVKPRIYVNTNANQFSQDNPNISVSLNMDVEDGETTEKPYDVYVVIGTPDAGTPENPLLFHGGKNEFDLTTAITPYLENVFITASDTWEKVFNYTFNAAVKAGDYFIHVVIVDKESGEMVSEDHVNMNYDPEYESPFVKIDTLPSTPEDNIIYEPITSKPTINSFLVGEGKTQLAEKLSEDGYPIFKKVKQVKGLFDTVFTATGLIDYYGDLISDCSKSEAERDTLFAVKVLETIFNQANLFGDVALADAVEYVAGIFAGESRAIAQVTYFDIVLAFEHDEYYGWWTQSSRQLEVTVEALYYFAGFQGLREEYYGKNMSNRITKRFSVDSKSQHRLTGMRPGVYLLTAKDTDGVIRRKMLTIDRATQRSFFENYKVGFNYGRHVKDTSGLGCMNIP